MLAQFKGERGEAEGAFDDDRSVYAIASPSRMRRPS
jgi:hypothetical protein